MPFEELKLDKSFVTDCDTDKVNAPLCKTVIDLAHSFGRYVVAVGIEKAADAVALVSMGCDYGQGYLLGQPTAGAFRFAFAPTRGDARAQPGRRRRKTAGLIRKISQPEF
jgi:EAL domain-containing protein (putative c-di-GMP-specific phosphodiesterase class I)